MSIRGLKKRIDIVLGDDSSSGAMAAIEKIPEKQAINGLIPFFHSKEEKKKWRAVTVFGATVDRLAKRDLEGARIFMRRLIWNLNDESGGIGWGSPEAMGEATARNETLAHEYARILTSYLDPTANYLEHPMLQRGLLWGIGRLAHERPTAVRCAGDFLSPFFSSDDDFHRAYAAWIAEAVPIPASQMDALKRLIKDGSHVRFYQNWQISEHPIASFAIRAIEAQG